MSKVVVQNLYKIYGSKPKAAIKLLNEGKGKDEVLKETGMAVGVNDVSFTVEEGETFVIMGLSGSGKSTVIRCLNRLIEPTSGDIILDGQNLTKMKKGQLVEVRRTIMSMVFQNFALFPNRPGGLRGQLSRSALRRNEAAGGAGARPGKRPGDFAHGRGIQRAGSADSQ